MSIALADRLNDGDYKYNDTHVSNVSANVSSNGAFLTIGSQAFLYDAINDRYVSDPVPSVIITWTDHGYRYTGVNSSTGFCTLYPNP